MFGLMGVARMSGQGAAWNPRRLFRNSEQGVWYDPSDFSSMFQDSAGTTPVTAVEQPVGKINDKSGNGNHATQATAAARPVVSARKNLLERSEEFDNAYWAKDTVTIVANAATAPDGTASADLAYPTSTGVYRYLFKGVGSAANVGDSLTYTVCVKSAGQRWVAILSPGSGGNGGAFVDLQNGVFGEIGAGVTATIQSLGDGWYKCCLTQLAVASTVYAGVTLTDADGSYTVTASGTDGVYVWGAQLEVGSTATRYQRVTTASDYDTVGFPHYLAFDGIDDSLVTAAVDLTGTYQVSAFAGFSVSYVGNFATLYANGWAYESGEPNAGNFVAFAPENGSGRVRFDQGGVTTASNVTVSVDGTAAHVYVQSMDSTASPYQVIRVDGVQVATSTVNVGGQPFAGTAIKIADRDHGFGASFFSGKLYQLIIRGAASTEAEINATEAYIASKSGATL